MKVVLIRHARVRQEWQKRYDSASYDRDNILYDSAAIEDLAPIDLPIEKVYISTLPRTAATAAFLVGNKRVEMTDLLDEVPIRSSFDTSRKLPIWLWNILATWQWHWNHPRQLEPRRRTDGKIEAFLDRIEAAGEDCIVVGHGIHFYRMMRHMRARGYRGEIKRYMRNGEMMSFEFDPADAGRKAR